MCIPAVKYLGSDAKRRGVVMVNFVNVFIDGIPVQEAMNPVEIKVLNEETNQALPSDNTPLRVKLLE